MGKRTIEEELERQQQCVFQTVGDSMEPLLHSRKSTVVIEKPQVALKKYDVVLYRRPAGEYVLHRIVKVRARDYLICGDNRIYAESVPGEWILGVMTGVYPDESGRFLSCQDAAYRKYLQWIPVRYAVRWMKALPGRICRKLAKRKNLDRARDL